jgi:AraC family L-rhamnose operon transcriptional activator RhaR
VLRPGAWHAFSGCADLSVANCCISAQALRTELAALHEIPMFHRLLWTDPVTAGSHGVHVTTVGPDAATEAITAIDDLERDLSRGRRAPGRMLGRLVTVLGILADGRDPARVPDEPAIHPAVAACVARLEATPAEPWRLDDLARAVNLDPAYLGRLFRRSVGLSPLGFLARVRVEHAATLLTHSTLPVARVGAAVGWDDPTYFARRFRILAGLTPTEYRRHSQSSPPNPA